MKKIHNKLNRFFDLEESNKLGGNDFLWIIGGAIMMNIILFGGIPLLQFITK